MIRYLTVPSYLLRTGIALAACLLLLGIATGSWAATNSQCANKWSQSSADDTCSDETISAQGDDCSINASCTTSAGHNVRDSITVHLNQVSGIRNCNGSLTISHCQ